jgi:hypothetical protein
MSTLSIDLSRHRNGGHNHEATFIYFRFGASKHLAWPAAWDLSQLLCAPTRTYSRAFTLLTSPLVKKIERVRP